MKRILVALLLCVACSSNDTGAPTAGALTLQFAGASGSDGGVLVIVSGGPVTSVDAPAGYEIATNADGEGTHIMVVGALASGTIATINVPDVSLASSYVATVVQVSDRASYALLDPVRYKVTVGK